MEVKISQAIPLVETFIRAKLVPIITGSPGIGKSEIIHQIAAKYGLKVIDIRLAQCDPTDLAGFPTVVGEKADYLPMKHFPLESDPVPEGYNGWLFFMDEITSAVPAIQAASYKIILDRKVGTHNLHEKCVIVAAGNRETDGAVVHRMSTALQSRLAHISLQADLEEWTVWAGAKGVDHRIISYLRYKPDMFNNFRPDHVDNTYACPRTWAFADRVLKQTKDGESLRLPALAGVIGKGVASELLTFMEIYQNLPTIQQIEANPMTAPMSEEISVLYAVTGLLANHATTNNIGKLMKYIERLPVEFQVVALRDTIRRKKEMLQHPEILTWATKHATNLF